MLNFTRSNKLLLCLWIVVFALLSVAVLPISAQSDDAPTNVIIDTDMASDDWMAILYLLNNPNFSVKAITVTGTGLAYCDSGVQIALDLVALAEYGDVPVSCWTETPLKGENAFPAEWRVTMVGLDATNEVPMTMDFVNSFSEAAKTPEAQFVATMLAGNEESIKSGGYYFWDPLAAGILTAPELVTLETRHVTVVDAAGADNGRTKPTDDGPEIQVATKPDADAFKELFTTTLNS